MYKQLVTPNLDPVVYQCGVALDDWYGWCLATVQAAFSTGWAGVTAWDAWTNRVQFKHEDRDIPAGVYVPIWFSGYGGEGHVAIYKDGLIWTSPWKHVPSFMNYDSIEAIEAGYGITYVGWSEDIGGVRVVQDVPDVAPNTSQGGDDVAEKITVDTSRILTHGVLARNGVAGRTYSLDGDNGGDAYIGQDLSNALVQQLFLSDEARQWRDSSDPNSVTGINNRLAAGDAAQGQIAQLQAHVTELQGTIDQLNQTIGDATKNGFATKQQLQDALTKVAQLTSELQAANDKLGQLQQNISPTDPGDPSTVDLTYALKGLWANIKKYLHVK